MPTVMFGPVQNLGVPFLVNEFKYGAMLEMNGIDVVCFSETYLQEKTLKIETDPLDAYIIWQPEWMSQTEWEKLRRDVEAKGNPPLIGIFCDWFTGWNGKQVCQKDGTPYYSLMGTQRVLKKYDGALVDRAGGAVLRFEGYGGVIAEKPDFLSYGRMPSLAQDVKEVLDVPTAFPQDDRRYDVVFVGHRHVDAVCNRSFYLEKLVEICGQHGWRLQIRDSVSAGQMEMLMLNSKVCFNHSLGITLNMRPFEAFAAGCVLLTDSHCIENERIQDLAHFYRDPEELEAELDHLLSSPAYRQEMAIKGTRWVTENAEPRQVWADIITTAVETAEKVGRRARSA